MAYQEISMHLEHEAWQAVPLGLLWVDLRGWRIEQANPAATSLLSLDKQAAPTPWQMVCQRRRRSPWHRLHKTRLPGPAARCACT